MGFRIRNMTGEEVSIAVKWGESEGWDPGSQSVEKVFITNALNNDATEVLV